MSRLFEFVDGRDGAVLERDAAALIGRKELILAEAELAGAFAGDEERRPSTASRPGCAITSARF